MAPLSPGLASCHQRCSQSLPRSSWLEGRERRWNPTLVLSSLGPSSAPDSLWALAGSLPPHLPSPFPSILVVCRWWQDSNSLRGQDAQVVAAARNRWWNLGPQRTDWSPGALNPGLGSAQRGRQAAEPETRGRGWPDPAPGEGRDEGDERALHRVPRAGSLSNHQKDLRKLP